MVKIMKNLNRFCYLVGGFKVYEQLNHFYQVYRTQDGLWKANDIQDHVYHSGVVKKNLERYASKNDENKGWALVTGASEGIGRQYAFDLAKTGLFNIAIASRSIDKLYLVKD